MSLAILFQQSFAIEQSVSYSASLLVIYLLILFVLWLSNILLQD